MNEREREREKEIYQPYTHSNFNTTHYLPPPTQVPSPTGIANSFKKLMRACSPSGSQGGGTESGYMTAIQESLWMDQLSLLMQLAGAVADLIDIQGSSVLVCLENGWDTTAQVCVYS